MKNKINKNGYCLKNQGVDFCKNVTDELVKKGYKWILGMDSEAINNEVYILAHKNPFVDKNYIIDSCNNTYGCELVDSVDEIPDIIDGEMHFKLPINFYGYYIDNKNKIQRQYIIKELEKKGYQKGEKVDEDIINITEPIYICKDYQNNKYVYASKYVYLRSNKTQVKNVKDIPSLAEIQAAQEANNQKKFEHKFENINLNGYAIFKTNESKRKEIITALKEKGYNIGLNYGDYIVTYFTGKHWQVLAVANPSRYKLVTSIDEIPSVAQIEEYQAKIAEKESPKPSLSFPAAAEYRMSYTKLNGETKTYYVSNPISEDGESITTYAKSRGIRKFLKNGIIEFIKIS